MSILDSFDRFKQTAVITRTTTTNVSGIPTKSTATIATVKALFWEGGATRPFVDDRFKDKTPAYIGLPVSTGIRDGDTVAINGRTYSALDPDDVGLQGKIHYVAMARKT